MKKSILLTLFAAILVPTAFSPAKAQDDLIYVAVEPCRIVDTRNAGGAIPANTFRNFRVSGTVGELAVQGGNSDCLDPKAATGLKPLAVSAYVLAVPATTSTGNGVLTAYPSDQLPPAVGKGSTVNFAAGQVVGNTTNITLCDPTGCPSDGEFAILARSTDEHVVIDVQGYFYPLPSSSAVSGYEQVTELVSLAGVAIGFVGETEVQCPAGKSPFGGSYSSQDGIPTIDVWRSYISNNGLGWAFSYTTLRTTNSGLIFKVVCANAAP